MIARLLICPDVNQIREEIQKTLALHLEGFGRELSRIGVNVNHPDLLYITAGEKLGIAEARKIKGHFALKPYSAKGRIVIIEDAGDLTHEAQNALLKTLEEPPKEALLILGAGSDANLLPTILSRCQIIHIQNPTSHRTPTSEVGYEKEMGKLLESNIEERFEYIEKLKDRELFLHYLAFYFRDKLIRLPSDLPVRQAGRGTNETIKEFLKRILQAEQWAKQNVNIRAILEYLMLVMPKRKS